MGPFYLAIETGNPYSAALHLKAFAALPMVSSSAGHLPHTSEGFLPPVSADSRKGRGQEGNSSPIVFQLISQLRSC